MQFGFWFRQQIFFGQTGARGFKQKKEEDKRIKKLPIIGEDEIDVKCRPCFFGCLLQSLSEWFIKLLQEEVSTQAEGWTSLKVKISKK